MEVDFSEGKVVAFETISSACSLKVLQPFQILEQEDEACSIIRNDEIAFLGQDYLMVRLDTVSNPYERRALFNFKDDQVDWSKTRSARLRLNLVACGLGHRECKIPTK